MATVSPIADTYIEAGEEVGWSHGGRDSFDVGRTPVGIAYLKFDLRQIK